MEQKLQYHTTLPTMQLESLLASLALSRDEERAAEV